MNRQDILYKKFIMRTRSLILCLCCISLLSFGALIEAVPPVSHDRGTQTASTGASPERTEMKNTIRRIVDKLKALSPEEDSRGQRDLLNNLKKDLAKQLDSLNKKMKELPDSVLQETSLGAELTKIEDTMDHPSMSSFKRLRLAINSAKTTGIQLDSDELRFERSSTPDSAISEVNTPWQEFSDKTEKVLSKLKSLQNDDSISDAQKHSYGQLMEDIKDLDFETGRGSNTAISSSGVIATLDEISGDLDNAKLSSAQKISLVHAKTESAKIHIMHAISEEHPTEFYPGDPVVEDEEGDGHYEVPHSAGIYSSHHYATINENDDGDADNPPRRSAEELGYGPTNGKGRRSAEELGYGSTNGKGRRSAEELGYGPTNGKGRRSAEELGYGPTNGKGRRSAEELGYGSMNSSGHRSEEEHSSGPLTHDGIPIQRSPNEQDEAVHPVVEARV